MNIGVDLLGGDFAPEVVLEATKNLLQNGNIDFEITLIGTHDALEESKKELSNFVGVHYILAESVIEMNDHPAKAFKEKPTSSISLGFQLLAKEKIDAFASAGNSGAMLVGSHFFIKTLPNIIRPTMGVFVPQLNGTKSFLLDVGLNTDTKPENLLQFAQMGSLFAKEVLKIDTPKIGLLNIGEEPSKGNILVQNAYPLLSAENRINFIGNIEGRDIFTGKANVFVCDGFTGNILLKLCESIYDINQNRNLNDSYLNQFNFEVEGGVPLLGIDKIVIVGHGVSTSLAIQNMILQAATIKKTNFINVAKDFFQISK